MKGMSLPINMIVIVAIAVLVLVVVAAFFVGGLKPLQQIEVENAFNKGCTALRAGYNCAASSISSISISDYYYDSNAATFTVKAGESVTMSQVCTLKGFGTDLTACARACGCPL